MCAPPKVAGGLSALSGGLSAAMAASVMVRFTMYAIQGCEMEQCLQARMGVGIYWSASQSARGGELSEEQGHGGIPKCVARIMELKKSHKPVSSNQF